MSHRVPPYNEEIEKSLLGSFMIDSDGEDTAKVINSVDRKMFYIERHKIIFDSIKTLFINNKPVNILTVTQDLREKGLLEKVGGAVVVTEIGNYVVTSAEMEYFLEKLKEMFYLREVLKKAGQAIELVYNRKDKTTEEIIAECQQSFFDIKNGKTETTHKFEDVIIENIYKEIDERMKTKKKLLGISTGYKFLDYLTSGLQDSSLIIVAARPSMGKTTFALNLGINAAAKGVGVVMFSLEMSKEELSYKVIANISSINSHKIRSGNITETELRKMNMAVSKIAKYPLFFNEQVPLTADMFRTELRNLKYQHPEINLAIVDYIQLMESNNGRNRTEEISEITRGLKLAAKELKMPVIALSQLSRKVEERTDKRPVLSDLRDSGAIEQDADMVMFLYRDDYYNRDSETPDVTELIISKNRNGSIGVVEFLFKKELSQFYEIDKRRNQHNTV